MLAGQFASDLVGVLTAVRGAAAIKAKLPEATVKSLDAVAQGPMPGGMRSQLGAVGDLGKGPRVLQPGGNTLNNSTASALNKYFGEDLIPRDWGRALEALKADAGKLPNNFHGKILSNGDYVGKNGEVIGNIKDYLP